MAFIYLNPFCKRYHFIDVAMSFTWDQCYKTFYHDGKLKCPCNLLQNFNPRNCRYCGKLPWYFYNISLWGWSHKTFWHKFTYPFFKLDHFINVHNICTSVVKRSSFQKSEQIYVKKSFMKSTPGTVFTTLHFLCNLWMGPIGQNGRLH